MDRIQKYLTKLQIKDISKDGKYDYKLIDYWDHDAERAIDAKLAKKLDEDSAITFDDCEYDVAEAYWDIEKNSGMAIIREVKRKVSDTATSVVHKCGAEDFTKQKLSLFGKTSVVCPSCKVKFYRDNMQVPDTVDLTIPKSVANVKFRKKKDENTTV